MNTLSNLLRVVGPGSFSGGGGCEFHFTPSGQVTPKYSYVPQNCPIAINIKFHFPVCVSFVFVSLVLSIYILIYH